MQFPPPAAAIITNRYQLYRTPGSNSQASLRVIPLDGLPPYTFQWSVVDPSGQPANHLLDSTDSASTNFTPGDMDGPYDIYCTVTDIRELQHTASLVLQVGGAIGLDVTTERLGVIAGGGPEGQTTIRLNPRAGTPPFNVTWVCTGPDGKIDNERLDTTNPLMPVFTSSDLVGTYVLTATLVDARGDTLVESVVVVVGQILGLDVIASRTSVLPGGGKEGMATLLATPIGGNEPYAYDWEILGPDGQSLNELLWDRNARSPIFESSNITGPHLARCAVADADGEMLIGSTVIVVGQQISVDVTADRLALPGDRNLSTKAILTTDIRGGRDPVSVNWKVVGPNGQDYTANLDSSNATQVVFTPDVPNGSYVVRCTAKDADMVSATDSLVLSVGGALGVVVTTNKRSLAFGGASPTGTAQLSAQAYGGEPPYTFAWSATDPSGADVSNRINDVSSENPIFASGSTFGAHEVLCRATDSVGVTAIDTVIINVGQPLNVDVTVDKQVLTAGGGVSGQTQFTVTINGGSAPYRYQWSVLDPTDTSDPGRLSDTQIPNPIFTSTPTTGTYRLTLTTTDALGVVFVDSVELVVESAAGGAAGERLLLDVSADRQTILPGGSTASLQASATGGVAPLTYSWSVTNPLGASDNSLLDSTSASVVTFTSSSVLGTYRVRCTVTDAEGSQFIDSSQITVSDSFFIDLTADVVQVAPGSTVNILADRTGGSSDFTYTWSCVDESNSAAGAFATGSSGVGTALQVASDDASNIWTAPAAGPGVVGTYRITVIATDANGYSFTDSVMISVSNAFAIDVSASSIQVAPGGTTVLTADRIGGSPNFTYNWSCVDESDSAAGAFATGSSGVGTALQIAPDDASNIWTAPAAGPGVVGTYRITVIASDANGYSFTDSVMISVSNAFAIDVSASSIQVAPGGTIVLTADRIGGSPNFSYSWSCLDGSGASKGTFSTGSTGAGAALQVAADDVTNNWTAPAAGTGTLGTYRIQVSATDILGNVAVDSLEVVVLSPLSLSLAADQIFVAPSTAIGLSADQTDGETPYNYSWLATDSTGTPAGTFTTGSTGAGTAAQNGLAGDATNSWSVATQGNYTIYCTVTDNAGQNFTDSISVVTSPQEAFSLNVTADRLTIVPGETVNLVGDQTGGTANFNYAWSALDEANAAAGTLGAANQNNLAGDTTNTWTAPTGAGVEGSYRISCTVTDSLGSGFTDSVLVEIPSLVLKNDVISAPPAASPNSVLGSTRFNGQEPNADPGQQIVAGFTNPTRTRNVTITITDFNSDNSITSGKVRITGLNASGQSQSEVINIIPPAGGSSITTGAVPFSTVTRIDLYDYVGVVSFPPGQADTFTIGVGDKFSLDGILDAAGDVLYTIEGGTLYTAGFTADATTSQQGITFVNAPDGARNYIISYYGR